MVSHYCKQSNWDGPGCANLDVEDNSIIEHEGAWIERASKRGHGRATTKKGTDFD
jgi:hypothetical protein